MMLCEEHDSEFAEEKACLPYGLGEEKVYPTAAKTGNGDACCKRSSLHRVEPGHFDGFERSLKGKGVVDRRAWRGDSGRNTHAAADTEYSGSSEISGFSPLLSPFSASWHPGRWDDTTQTPPNPQRKNHTLAPRDQNSLLPRSLPHSPGHTPFHSTSFYSSILDLPPREQKHQRPPLP